MQMPKKPQPRQPRALIVAITTIATITTIAAIAISCSMDREDKEGAATDQSVTNLTDPGAVIGEELMVTLAQAKNFHHKADVHLIDAELTLAIASLRKILALPFPADAPEGVDVLLDARARVSKLLVTAGDLEEAMTIANDGLASNTRSSFFLANLHTVRGHVWEDVGQRADESKDVKAGREARVNAIKDFDRAIEINNAVLKRLAESK